MASNHGTENEIIAGLDLGTTKVCAIVAEVTDDGLDIIGVGSVPSRGLRRGVVVNIETTVQAIRGAIEQAETMAGVEIRSVYAGIAGSHVRGMNKDGVAAIANREVTADDVARVLDQARAIPLTSDRQVIHVLPQEYIVDEQDCIKEPIGMSGVRLQAHVHLVTAATTSVQNIIKCAERCDLHVAEVVLEPLASAHAVLQDDEKELGVALVDIGGGTTDIVVYVNGAVVHTSVIPIGGTSFTNDIATCLRTPIAEAERVKIKYGCASPVMVDPEATIEVPSVGGRAPRVMPRQQLCQIIEPRVEELFQAVAYTIDQGNYRDLLGAGVVVTGGTTMLDGMPELAEQILGLPVRRGAPTGVGGLMDVVKSPAYATGVGLVKYGAEKLRSSVATSAHRHAMDRSIVVPAGPTWGARLGAWFREVF
ncbi:cell division protein FtsA [Sandaracinus amylolyticus]|uniref:cell division protein FtsA n=1 Tax=Sandaracinus amylolyticus TaxID=927083 RepID=UPI001F00CE9A|nr:Cell division protein FtsA [Sandaracinus amylolyticus]